MSSPEERPGAEDAPEADALPEGDIEALLARAKDRRAARDMKGCLEAYRAAAELGSADACFAVALFAMNGSSFFPQDLKEGATALRSAAERGSVSAKVFLGNLYEQGIHYKADPEKADVWYRSAARAAQIEGEPGTEEHARALAELGCIRYVLALAADDSLDEEEKGRLLSRAKSLGYGLKVKDASDVAAEASGDRGTFTDALLVAEQPPASKGRQRADTAPATKTARQKAADVTKQRTADTVPPTGKTSNVSDGLAAFGYALLFATAGLGAAYASTLGARELVARGTPLPLLGMRVDLVFPIVLAVIGILPAWLVYRLPAFGKSLVAGGVMGAIGWAAWGTGKAIDASRSNQAMAFALAGFLAALLVVGLLGGTKLGGARPSRLR